MPIKCKAQRTLESHANHLGLSVSRGVNGEWFVGGADSATSFVYKTEKEAREAMSKMVGGVVKDLDGGLPMSGMGTPSAQTPPRPQQLLDVDVTPLRRSLAAFSSGIGSWITPIKQFAQSIEVLGKGAAYTLVYKPSQQAAILIDELLGSVKRNSLRSISGKKQTGTYQDAIHAIDKMMLGWKKERRELVTLWGEAFTRDELMRHGALLKNGFSPEEQLLAAAMIRLGKERDIPMLVRRNQLIDDFIKNREQVINVELPKLEKAIVDGDLPGAILQDTNKLRQVQDHLERMKENAGVGSTPEMTWESVVKDMGYSKDEIDAMSLLQAAVEANTNEVGKYDIGALYRLANAPKANPKYANGRKQFEALHNMTAEEITVAQRRWAILQEGFNNTNFAKQGKGTLDQVIGAQLPIFRQFIDVGIMPGTKRGSVLDNLLEGREIFTRRVLSGHNNPRELDPSLSTYKHVRNMIMNDVFDPVLADALNVVETIADPAVKKVLVNYLHEVQGLPGEGFKKLDDAIRTTLSFTGQQVPKGLSQQIVSTLGKLAYQSSIPFRPALILRNYLQTVFFTLPVIGPKAWIYGLKQASGRGSRRAMEEAIAAGAIDVNVVPLHGATEILGRESYRFMDALAPSLQKVGYSVDELFDRGFSWYRSADDWGRAVAFHAGKNRVDDAYATYLKHGDFERFLGDAKVKTFNEIIEQEFITLMNAGRVKDAGNLIGKQLADKTHLLYGHANHPSGWGGVKGRLFGQFGTFPVQYLNFVSEGLFRGTPKDKAEFFLMHSAMNVGIIVGGAELFGADLETWATVPSLTYTGGPYAEAFLSLALAAGGSEQERNLALRNLNMMLPSLDDPQSIALPGSYFLGDLVDAYQENDPLRAIGEATGLRFLKPGEKNIVKRAFEWMF